MMTTIRPSSAQIIPFPSPAAASARKFAKMASAANESVMRSVPVIELGAGWYHQAAVDSDRSDRHN